MSKPLIESYTIMVYSMTEKKTPHHDLRKINATFLDGTGRVTRTATMDAAGLGYGYDEIAGIIQTITQAHFYKSMTSNYDNAVWQDVYHVPDASSGKTLYVKFTDNGGPDFVLLSFKEK
jgi:hypothetical protein